MKFKKATSIIFCLNALLNGPAYDTKADAINTSPEINNKFSSRTIIELLHLSFSLPRADTSLYARSNLLAHLSASLTAAVFSSLASLYSALSLANLAFNISTFSYTIAAFSLASDNY